MARGMEVFTQVKLSLDLGWRIATRSAGAGDRRLTEAGGLAQGNLR